MPREIPKGMDFIPVSEITKPPTSGLFRAYSNYWWAVTEKNEVMVFKNHPQCNSHKEIIEQIDYIGTHAQLIPVAYIEQSM